MLHHSMKNDINCINIVLDNAAPSQLEHLIKQLIDNSRIETLELSVNSEARKMGMIKMLIEAAMKNTNLVSLDLSSNEISAYDAIMVSKLLLDGTLEKLILWDNKIRNLGAAIIIKTLETSKLHVLDIGANGITTKGISSFENILSNNKYLTFLRLTDNKIKDEGVIIISKALQQNHTLLSLDLANDHITSDGIIALANALKVNSTLNYLNLNHNMVGVNGAEAVADMLQTNNTITHLSLMGSKLASRGGIILANALKKNKTLRILNLNANDLEDDGVIEIAQMLRANETISSLSLCANKVSNEGVETLVKVLSKNYSLADLDIALNGAVEMITVADMLRTNTTLVSLNLPLNAMSVKGMELLVTALKDNLNSNLSSLDSSFCSTFALKNHLLNG